MEHHVSLTMLRLRLEFGIIVIKIHLVKETLILSIVLTRWGVHVLIMDKCCYDYPNSIFHTKSSSRFELYDLYKLI